MISANFNNGFLDISKKHKDANGNNVDNKVISNYVALNIGVLF